MKVFHRVTLVLFYVFSVAAAYAVQLPGMGIQDSTDQKENTVVDSLGRSTPSGSINGFFRSIANSDYQRASRYIDFSAYNEKDNDSVVFSMVKKMEVLLNKYGTILPVSVISSSAQGMLNDGLPYTLEEIGVVEINGRSAPLYLELVNLSERNKGWLISEQTTDSLISYINTYQIGDNNEKTNTLFATKWKGAPVADWLGMIILALGAYAIAWAITLALRWLVRRFQPEIRAGKYSNWLLTLLLPLRLILAVVILLVVSRIFGISIIVRQSFSVVNLTAFWTAVFIFIWLLINSFSSFAEERLRGSNKLGGLSAVSFFRNSAKFALVVLAVLIAFDTIGVNVTAGLAALGVGGIALALGAQKTVENIVGGLSVVFDQPVAVGDFCRFGDTLGTVEKIGMRSTRIRTTGRTVVTIPNADFSSQLIENYSKRDLFLFNTTIGLRYETSSDQMRYILVELRSILFAHPKVSPDPARVRFVGYGSDALNVELFAYIHAVNWDDFLAVQEDINLRIAEVVEQGGSGFAFPSRTLYFTRDTGGNEANKSKAEQKVKEWMEKGELNLPYFDKKTKDKLKGSIDYPKNKG